MKDEIILLKRREGVGLWVYRFHVLTWGHPSKESPYGIIAGGTDTGELELYDAVCLLNGYR